MQRKDPQLQLKARKKMKSNRDTSRPENKMVRCNQIPKAKRKEPMVPIFHGNSFAAYLQNTLRVSAHLQENKNVWGSLDLN